MDRIPAYIGLEMVNPLNGYRSILVGKSETGVWVFERSLYYHTRYVAPGGLLPNPNEMYKHLRAFRTEKLIEF